MSQYSECMDGWIPITGKDDLPPIGEGVLVLVADVEFFDRYVGGSNPVRLIRSTSITARISKLITIRAATGKEVPVWDYSSTVNSERIIAWKRLELPDVECIESLGLMEKCDE